MTQNADWIFIMDELCRNDSTLYMLIPLRDKKIIGCLAAPWPGVLLPCEYYFTYKYADKKSRDGCVICIWNQLLFMLNTSNKGQRAVNAVNEAYAVNAVNNAVNELLKTNSTVG